MKKIFLAAASSVLLLGAVGSASAADPPGNAYGYWAGRLCDHIGPTTDGMTYWEHRALYFNAPYPNRGQCVKLEGQSLARGEWDPADWPI